VLIEAKKVNFKNILNYPDIEIESEHVTFICGDSGSGKSTFLKLINGVVSPLSGNIIIEGKNISDLNTVELRKEYLLVSQSVYLFDKTIKKNYEEFYRYRDLPTPEDKAIQYYLTLCCADFSLDSYCPTMSGGERQRVYIAICLSFKPKVLMLDEPTSALDSHTANLLMQNINTFCRNNHITLIVVSHDISLADKFADKVITLEGSV
jgi:ABC-type cobalamin/Fe3+-siderophores transport systems, ATPase components